MDIVNSGARGLHKRIHPSLFRHPLPSHCRVFSKQWWGKFNFSDKWLILEKVKQLAVIYEDQLCIVVNKPAGLAVQGGKKAGISLDRILAQRAALQKVEPPLLVHRLDRDTSGLVLVAKDKAAAAFFSRLLGCNSSNGKAVIKRYLAICRGLPSLHEGVIQTDLEIRGAVKKSETRYRLISGSDDGQFSLLELELGSGRMHQIRRHLSLNGNPVLGDDKYGDFKLNHSLRKTMNLRNLLLHAARIIIPHTSEGFSLDVSAPLPDYFQEFISNILTQKRIDADK